VLFLENDLRAKFVRGFWLLHQASCIGLQNGRVLPGWSDVKAERKRFNQMVAKWLNRSAFSWGILYLASRVLGAYLFRWYARMSGGGLWNDYGACELGCHDTLLLACQQHRLVAYFSSNKYI